MLFGCKSITQNGTPVAFPVKKTNDVDSPRFLGDDIKRQIFFDLDKSYPPCGQEPVIYYSIPRRHLIQAG